MQASVDPKTPLLSHLIELRRRILMCFALFICVFAIAYYFSDTIYVFLQQPLIAAFDDPSQRRMIYTGLHEAFFTYLKLAFFTATLVSMPMFLIQIWRFIAPGMYSHEKRNISPLFISTPILFYTGAALAFYVVMPLAWDFFIGFENNQSKGVAVELEARISEYLGIVIQLTLAFGLCFELPVLLMVLAKAGIVTPESLRRYRRHAIVGVFLCAALLTPPDLISQIALGLPIILLYELSILLIHWQTNASAIAPKSSPSQ